MSDGDSEMLLELREIRKLLQLLAEPAIAERDAKLRKELRNIVGASAKRQQSVLLMDGSRLQSEIMKRTGVDRGDLSRTVAKLDAAGLLKNDRRQPQLAITIPSNFFESDAKSA